MSFLSGDLAPARKGGRRAFGRRRRRALPLVLGVLLLAALVGGAALLRRDDAGAGSRLAASGCPVKAGFVTSALPAPAQVRLRLFNGTSRAGLAGSVGAGLAARGFVVAATGNAPAPLPGASKVYFGPGGRPAATVLAAHVPGAVLAPVPTAGRGAVDLVLGTGFQRLRTPAEVARALAPRPRPLPSRPAATPRPSASPC